MGYKGWDYPVCDSPHPTDTIFLLNKILWGVGWSLCDPWPNWPNEPSPHVNKAPVSSIAAIYVSPQEIEVIGFLISFLWCYKSVYVTKFGVDLQISALSPNWPNLLFPQLYSLPVSSSAKVKSPPVLIALILAGILIFWKLNASLIWSPSPSPPCLLVPITNTSPWSLSTVYSYWLFYTVYCGPQATIVTPEIPTTMVGSDT